MDGFKDKLTKRFTFRRKLNHDLIISDDSLPFGSDGNYPFFIPIPRLETYRKAIFLQCGLAGVVLLCNIVLLVYAAAKYEIHGGLGTLYTGSCYTAHKTDVVIHFFVNVLSTTLLAASNYCLQCLTAPTRKDVDKAHAEKRFVDIGIPSLKNLQFIPKRRVFLWATLVLSSLPLHLLFNSVVFQTTSANAFSVTIVSETFIGANKTAVADMVEINRSRFMDMFNDNAVSLAANSTSSSWVNMTNHQCLKEYGKGYVSKYGHLLLVSKSHNQSELAYISGDSDPTSMVPYAWICGMNSGAGTTEVPGSCYPNKINPNKWKFTENDQEAGFRRAIQQNITNDNDDFSTAPRRTYDIDYCMAEKSSENCKLKFSQTILIVVILMNVTKAACMLYIAACDTKHEPILTIGDAVSSFMRDEDQHTSELCAAPFRVIQDSNQWDMGRHAQARRLGNYPRRWMCSASLSRWVITVCFGASVLLASGLLLMPATWADPNGWTGGKSAKTIWNDGLGELQPDSLLNMPVLDTLLKNVILSNTPQLVLSVLYLMFNALFTCMLTNLEWTKFGIKRSNLRVSFPRKGQTSTYRLQLPYRYGIPLLIFSLLFHWLVSQSLFVAQIDILVPLGTNLTSSQVSGTFASIAYDMVNSTETAEDGRKVVAIVATCGYSVLAICLAMIVCFFALAILLGIGYFKKYPGKMQVGATCSALISAACHSYRPADGEGAQLKKLQWGAIEEVAKGSKEGAGHLTFTSGEVLSPTKEEFYGVPREVAFRAMINKEQDSLSISSSVDKNGSTTTLTSIPLY